MEQTITAIGNSAGIIIPAKLRAQLDWETGNQVFITKLDDDSITIRKVTPANASAKSSKTTSEFKKWLEHVLEEDAEVLDELAVR